MVPSLPLLSCGSSVSVKENPDRKKKKKKKNSSEDPVNFLKSQSSSLIPKKYWFVYLSFAKFSIHTFWGIKCRILGTRLTDSPVNFTGEHVGQINYFFKIFLIF